MDRLLYYLWYGPKEKLRYLWVHRLTKVTFRLRKGFWPDECWNLDLTFAKFILPRLKYFKNKTNGYPSNLTEAEWDRNLDDMITAFAWIASKSYYDAPMKEDGSIDHNAYLKLHEDAQRGFELFGQHYMGLWD